MYEGTYTDGLSAIRHRVHVTLTMNRLYIADEEGNKLDEWPFPGIRIAGGLYDESEPVRLAHQDKGDARLFFPSQKILDRLAGQAPGLHRRRPLKRRILVQAGISLAALGVFLAVLLAALPYAADNLAPLIPRRWEESIGARIMAAFEERFPPCGDTDGLAALKALAARITGAQSNLPPVRIHVLQSPIPNAFAIPGGHIGIFKGLIRFTDSPEELAGVLAHEIAHNTRRHPMKSILRQSGYRLIFSAISGDGFLLGSSAAKTTERLLNLSFTREAERESDRTAIEMLNRAGIRSDGLSRFLTRLSEKDGQKTSRGGYFSTHPAPRERVEAMRDWTKAGMPAMTTGDWEAVRRMCQVREF